jgi:RHS repeat-associated protein
MPMLSVFNEYDYKKDPADIEAPELVDDPKKSQIVIGLSEKDIANIKEQLATKEVQLDEVRRQQLEQDLARGYTLAQAQAAPKPTLESVYGPSYHMKWRYRGNRHYELDNHLGNVQVVITDKKIAHGSDNWEYYTADILSVHDYYAFGQDIEERSFERSTYRYGMNGQEKDNDVFVGAFSAQYWEYDSRTGRRWNIDPVDQISISNYACFKNNPINLVDPDGSQTIEPVRGVKSRFERKFQRKIGSELQKLKDAGATREAIQKKADELATKYQNRKWFRHFAKGTDAGGAQSKEKGGTSNSTGWVRDEKITINPFPAEQTQQITSRDGSQTQAQNNQDIATRLIAQNGATVTAVFNPMSQPNGLTVKGTGTDGTISNILTSGGQVQSTDAAQLQSFTYRTTVNSNTPLALSVNVSNTNETPTNPDRWNLTVTVQNPFSTDPNLIVKSNVSIRPK